MYTHVSMYMVTCMHVSVALFVHLCMCVCEHRCAYVCMHVCVHTCQCVGGVIWQNCEEYTKRDKNVMTGKNEDHFCVFRDGGSLCISSLKCHLITVLS